MENLITPSQDQMPPVTSGPSDQVAVPPVTDSRATRIEKGSMRRSNMKLTVALAVVAILAGVGTGWGGTRLQGKTIIPGAGGPQPMQQVATGTVKAGDVFGVADESTFKDSVEGYLEAGGLDGEGSHKLLREGGDSQTVYLTSSVTDLEKFAGMKVKVWGETFKGQKAGWLMDVGRVQVIEPQAQPPTPISE